MTRNTLFRTGMALLVAGLLALLAGCGGDDNGGLSAEQMAQLSTAQTEATTAHEEAEEAQEEVQNLHGRIAELQEQIAALQMDDGDDETASEIEELEMRLAELRGRVDEEGTTTDPATPTSGPQADIGVDHVEGLTGRSGGVMFTNSPIAARIMPENYLSLDYSTSRRHHNVAFVNGVAPIGFAGRQNLPDAQTYGAWMEYNHFGVFQGTGDDGDGFTDIWSIGARSGSNPAGGALTWTGAFVGEEMMHQPSAAAGAMGNRMRGKADIVVTPGDSLTPTPDTAILTLSEIVNIDNTALGAGNPSYAATGATVVSGRLPIMGGLFSETGSSRVVMMPTPVAPATNAYGIFTVKGSFYGTSQQEAGGIFTISDTHSAAATPALDATTYELTGAFGVDRVGN